MRAHVCPCGPWAHMGPCGPWAQRAHVDLRRYNCMFGFHVWISCLDFMFGFHVHVWISCLDFTLYAQTVYVPTSHVTMCTSYAHTKTCMFSAFSFICPNRNQKWLQARLWIKPHTKAEVGDPEAAALAVAAYFGSTPGKLAAEYWTILSYKQVGIAVKSSIFSSSSVRFLSKRRLETDCYLFVLAVTTTKHKKNNQGGASISFTY